MLYKCKSCGHEVHSGCLPSVSCGLLLPLYGVPAGIVIGLFWAPVHRVLGFWTYLLCVPAAVAVMVASGCLLDFAEYGWTCLHRCPKCKKRKWSKGYFKGAGL